MYCTQADLLQQVPERVLVELTDDEGLGTVNQERVGRAVEDAAALIDSYASARYHTPLDPVPGVIRKVAVDIALYNLFSRRGYDEDSADKSVYDRYKAALAFLDRVAKGLVTIGASEPPAEGGATVQAGSRVFGRDAMKDW